MTPPVIYSICTSTSCFFNNEWDFATSSVISEISFNFSSALFDSGRGLLELEGSGSVERIYWWPDYTMVFCQRGSMGIDFQKDGGGMQTPNGAPAHHLIRVLLQRFIVLHAAAWFLTLPSQCAHAHRLLDFSTYTENVLYDKKNSNYWTILSNILFLVCMSSNTNVLGNLNLFSDTFFNLLKIDLY
jgi:hypothetical protein